MKKSLIALAALATVSAAQAQSSVTVYGLVDSGYRSTDSDALKYTASTNTTTVENRESKGVGSSSSASSRLGFRGTEDLGGGLRANFVVEVGLDATNPTVSTMNNRQSFVGLSGKFGTVNVGTQYTAHHNIAAAFSPTTGVNLAGDLNYTVGPVTSGALSNLGITTTAAALASGTTAANVTAAFNAVGNFTNKGGADLTASSAGTALQTALDSATTVALNNRLARADMNGYTVRRNNTISFASPVMNGFQIGLGYNAPATSKIEGGNEVKASSSTISASYSQGKFAAAAAVANGKSESVGAGAADSRSAGVVTPFGANGAAGTRAVEVITVTAAAQNAANTFTVKGRETIAAASYDLGVAKLGYIYSAKKAKDQISDLIDRDSHSVNASMPFGKVTAFANYAVGDQTVLGGTSNEVKYDLKAMQLGARYAFSKRTDAYAIYGQTKMDRNNSNLDLKDTQYAIGLRHQF